MPLDKPSDLELRAIRELADFDGRLVLEIGIGDGRLAWPFAPEAAAWIGLDPDAEEVVAAARTQRQPASAGRRRRRGGRDLPAAHPGVRLLVGDGRALSFPADSFDIVFFSWSLC